MPGDVLSLVEMLGQRSESWLYRQLLCPRRHRVQVLTQVHINRQEYPFSLVTQCHKRANTFSSRLARKLFQFVGINKDWLHKAQPALQRLVDEQPVRLIQAHFAWTGWAAFQLLKKDRPLLVWFYGSDIFRGGPFREICLPRLFKSQTWFACTSQALCKEALALGCNPARIRVIYPPLPLQEIKRNAFPKTPAANTEIKLLSTSRLIEFKAPLEYVGVAERLLASGLKFQWRILGSGPFFKPLQKALESSSAGAAVRLLGEQPNSVVLNEMRQADLFIHNGVIARDGTREALGVVLAEAAALGLPIVAANVGGIPEIVLQGKTGLLFSPGDADGMVAAIRSLAGDAEQRRAFGRAAQEHALNIFDEDKIAGKMDDYYDFVIGSRDATESNALVQS
jgi:glycosyltransferase involved in cell wall biosynthesis